MKPFFRAIQTFFPFVHTTKFAIYNWGTRHFGRPMDNEFKLLARIPEIGLILDVGANWGQSIAAIKHTARPRKVLSFEPNRQLAERLARIYANDANVGIENCALGEDAGYFDLFIPRYRNYVFDGLASLDENEAGTWLNPKRMAWFDPKKVTVEQQRVQVKTLDSFSLNPDVIKIDVQGAEHLVVKGGIETFRRSQPLSIIEEPNDDLVDLLKALGMGAHYFDGNRLRDDWRGRKNVVFLSDEQRLRLKL